MVDAELRWDSGMKFERKKGVAGWGLICVTSTRFRSVYICAFLEDCYLIVCYLPSFGRDRVSYFYICEYTTTTIDQLKMLFSTLEMVSDNNFEHKRVNGRIPSAVLNDDDDDDDDGQQPIKTQFNDRFVMFFGILLVFQHALFCSVSNTFKFALISIEPKSTQTVCCLGLVL